MRSPRRSANEQYELIMECRSSGLSDQQWCLQHDINPGTFYNWVKRLKAKKCYDIPPATGRDGLTASVKQDVVKVEILPDPSGQIHETAVSAHSTDTEQIRPQPLTLETVRLADVRPGDRAAQGNTAAPPRASECRKTLILSAF